MIGSALASSVPGVTSTTANRRTRSGWRADRQSAVRPPSDMPTTMRGMGASERRATATSSASWGGEYSWSGRQSEWPWPGRSTATSGRSSASATVSQVWAFWAPPWSSTISGSRVPQTRALTDRSGATSTARRSTVGCPRHGRPASSAFSSNIPSSS